MPNPFTTTTSTSWFSRMKNAFIGVLLGFLLIPGSMVLLFWNESRAINETYRLNEGESVVVKDVKIDSIDKSLEGKLVHVAGQVHALSPISDSLFGLEQSGLRLRRHVEMYQWEEKIEKETKKNIGGGRTTTETPIYKLDWHEGRIDSSDFRDSQGHTNPAIPYQSTEVETSAAEMGAFEFPERLIDSIHNWKDIELSDQWLQTLPPELQEHSTLANNRLYFHAEKIPKPDEPVVGDIRISFQLVPDSDVTLISQQHENSFRQYSTSHGDLELLEMGKLSAEQVFQRAHSANSMLTWGLRLFGFILMGAGFCMIMAPLSTFASIIPFLENVAGFGIAIVGFGLAAVLSAIVIAIAWIAVRPILGVSLLVLAGGIFAAMIFFRSSKPAAQDHGVELLN